MRADARARTLEERERKAQETTKGVSSMSASRAAALLPLLTLFSTLSAAGPRPGSVLDLHTATDANGMPLALFAPPIPTPVWLHAAAAWDGKLRTELMHPATARLLGELLSRPEVGGCISPGLDRDQRILSYPRSSDLDTALREAHFVLHARVTGAAGGFQASTPGTLLRLSPLRVARGTTTTKGPFYVFVPLGRVRVGNKVICKNDPEYAGLPEPGDEVLILSAPPGNEYNNQLDLETPGDLIVIHSGKLLFPKMYQESLANDPGPHGTPAELLDRIKGGRRDR
jgi:hypothetical protein